MEMDRRAGKIALRLTDEDFREIDWEDFLAELKVNIRPQDRRYDSETRMWYITDTPQNVEILNQLYEHYFKDERQLEFF